MYLISTKSFYNVYFIIHAFTLIHYSYCSKAFKIIMTVLISIRRNNARSFVITSKNIFDTTKSESD